MAKKPPVKPEDIFDEILMDLTKSLGTDLVSVCVFGSAARGAYTQGRSDINLLIETADGAKRIISRMAGLYETWASAGVAPPVVMSSLFIASSKDVFPIEFLTMAASHKCLHGEDPLADLKVEAGDLRLQLEREVKAKRLALGTRLLTSGGRDKALAQVAAEAAPAMKALLQGWLHLTAGSFPLEHDDVMAKCEEAGLAVDALRKLSLVRNGSLKLKGSEMADLIEQAEEQLAELGRRVDKM